jgi:hypothetical protein
MVRNKFPLLIVSRAARDTLATFPDLGYEKPNSDIGCPDP